MPKCIALLHNSQVIVEQVANAFEQIYPEAERINIIDESLLRDIKTKGRIDHLGVRRVCRYALCAEDLGADAVMMTCSSLWESVDAAKPMIRIPAFAINEPMSVEAVATGANIGVMGTLGSVLEPSARLILQKAKDAGKAVELKRVLCEAAFEALIVGDSQKHDALLLEELERAADEVDIMLFAQGSMSRLIPEARQRVSIPVLECIDSGVKQVKMHFDAIP